MKRMLATAALAFVFAPAFAGEVTLRSHLSNANYVKESLSRPSGPATVTTCAVPSQLPAGPPTGAVTASFNASWSIGDDAFTGTLWREPCPTDPALTLLYLRVVPTQGVPFICSSGFAAIVGGNQYDIKLIQTTNGSSWCKDTYVGTTLVVAQWSIDPPFDHNAALTLIFDGVDRDYTVALPAYTPGPGSVIRFPAQVPVSKWPAAHGVYAAIVAGDWTLAKQRYDANPWDVSDAMGAVAYWYAQQQ